MRMYLLTDREREILKRFLETGEKLNGFAVLIHYLRKGRTNIEADLNLIDAALSRIQEQYKNKL